MVFGIHTLDYQSVTLMHQVRVIILLSCAIQVSTIGYMYMGLAVPSIIQRSSIQSDISSSFNNIR